MRHSVHNLLTTSVHNLMTLTVHEVLTLYSPRSWYRCSTYPATRTRGTNYPESTAPTMAVIKRIQTDIAHAWRDQSLPAATSARTRNDTGSQQRRPSTPLTDKIADAVFIRPAHHYENI